MTTMIKVYMLAVLAIGTNGESNKPAQYVREYSSLAECESNIEKYAYYVRPGENYIRCMPLYRKRTEKDN